MLFNQPVSTKNEDKKIVQVSSLLSSQDLEAKNNGSDINNEQLEIIDLTENKIRYLYQGVIKSRSFTVNQRSETSSLWLSSIAGNLQFFDHSLSSNKSEKVGSDQVTASMDGLVVEVLVNEGDQVNSGDVVAIIEAMKMEHLLKASVSGHVEKVLTTAGTQVKSRQLLVQLKQSS